jgi:uncharacterized protein (TIGR03437 family)
MAVVPGAVYLAGWTGSSGSVAKLDPATSPAVSIDTVLPVIAFPPPTTGLYYQGVAPGQMIQINGHNLGPAGKASAQVDASGRLPFILANTVVFFNNVPAVLISVQATSILCVVPFEVGQSTRVTVSFNGQVSNVVLIGTAPSLPQILSIVNQDGSMNFVADPAKAGSVIRSMSRGSGRRIRRARTDW